MGISFEILLETEIPKRSLVARERKDDLSAQGAMIHYDVRPSTNGACIMA